MKKSFLKFVLAALVLLAAASAAQAVTVSSTTALDTATPPIQLQPNESATWSVVGKATGTIQLQTSRTQQQWDVIGTSITLGNIAWSGVVRSDDRAAFYRFRISTITAGVYATTISDQDDIVEEIKNNKGVSVWRVNDDSVRVLGNFSGLGLHPSTATTSGNSFGNSAKVYLAGATPAIEGSLIVATTPVANQGLAGIVAPATNDLTNWIGIAKVAAATGVLVDVYYSGYVLARTTGTVLPGDTLVSTGSAAGYLTSDATPTSGADVGVAMSSGTSAAGGLTKIRLR